MKCPVCYDMGKKDGCPRCGKSLVKNLDLDKVSIAFNPSLIPESYQGHYWNPPVSEDFVMADFYKKLDKIHSIYLSAKPLPYSLFLAGPPKIGKLDFAYSALQASIAQGRTTAPLMSTSEWRRLYKIAQINPFYKMYGKYYWDDLICADVVIITVDYSDDHNDDITLMKDIYDIRARQNLSTTIISDFKLEDLVPRWNSSAYNLIYSSNPKCDRKRYPLIIHCFKE